MIDGRKKSLHSFNRNWHVLLVNLMIFFLDLRVRQYTQCTVVVRGNKAIAGFQDLFTTEVTLSASDFYCFDENEVVTISNLIKTVSCEMLFSYARTIEIVVQIVSNSLATSFSGSPKAKWACRFRIYQTLCSPCL